MYFIHEKEAEQMSETHQLLLAFHFDLDRKSRRSRETFFKLSVMDSAKNWADFARATTDLKEACRAKKELRIFANPFIGCCSLVFSLKKQWHLLLRFQCDKHSQNKPQER